MKLRLAIVALGILALSQSALGGGDSWKVKVLRVENAASGAAVITLKPEEPSGPWAGCGTVTITAMFEREPWWRRTWSSNLVTPETHREALSQLSEAAKSGSTTRLGEMGSGFNAPTGRKCELESHGLALLEEFGRKRVVYSFYGAI